MFPNRQLVPMAHCTRMAIECAAPAYLASPAHEIDGVPWKLSYIQPGSVAQGLVATAVRARELRAGKLDHGMCPGARSNVGAAGPVGLVQHLPRGRMDCNWPVNPVHLFIVHAHTREF